MRSVKKSKREGEEAVGRRRLEVDFIIIIFGCDGNIQGWK